MSSQQLVELFQAQVAPNPELPPALIPDYTAGATAPALHPDETDGADGEGEGTGAEAEGRTRYARGAGGGRPVRVRRYQLPSPAGESRHVTPLAEGGAPAPPRFARSLVLRGELTVPRAGYSEPYTVW